MVKHLLGKQEIKGSIPFSGSHHRFRESVMKKMWIFIILLSAGAAFAATEVAPLNLQVQSEFDTKFVCGWKSATPLKIWVAPIEDARSEKEVGTLVIKDQETPLYSATPVTIVLEETLKKGLRRCGYTVTGKESADVVVGGVLEDFSGTSKKGVWQGKAQGRAEFVLNLKRTETHEQFSITFSEEETQEKGISKKPRKLEKILNNLLTRLSLDVFESRRVGEWLVKR